MLGIVGPKILQIPSYLFAKHPYVQTTSFQQNNHYVGIHARRFFCFIFIAPFFVGLRDPGNYYLKYSFMHTLICLITPSFLHGFQPNLYQYFSYVRMLYHTNNFQYKANTSIYLRGTFTLLVDNFHNLDPLRII